MRRYIMTTQFVIGDDEDVREIADEWLKETTREYTHPTDQFDIQEVITIKRAGDVIVKGGSLAMKRMPSQEKDVQQNEDGGKD